MPNHFTCHNCKQMITGGSGHFFPPVFGDEGFYVCEPITEETTTV